MEMGKTYLGDSVYAQFDGYHIVLTTENGLPSGPSNTIALEPAVLSALVRFRNDIYAPERTNAKEIPARFAPNIEEYEKIAADLKESLLAHGAAYEAVLDALSEVTLQSVYPDSVDLNIYFTGGKTELEKVWGILRRLEFEAPTERPKEKQSEWSGTFRREHDSCSVFVRFSSAVCRRVATGRKIEIDEYEIVCDDEATSDQSPKASAA